MAHEWREHARLKGRFRPDYPDDLQVIVHDGGPLVSRNEPEIVWVTVTGMNGDLFWGRLLNPPHNIQTVRQGDEIKFVMPTGDAPITLLALAAVRLGLEKPPRTGWLAPVLVTDKYLEERQTWNVHPCGQCGLSDLFDAPSDLIPVLLAQHPPDEEISTFIAPCPNCGAALRVESRQSPTRGSAAPRGAADMAASARTTRLAMRFLETGKLLVENMTAIAKLLGAISDDAAADLALPKLDQAIARHHDLSKQLDSQEMSMDDHLQLAQAHYRDYLATTSDISVSMAAAQMNAAAAQARAPRKAVEIDNAMKKLDLA